jgi:phage-related protein
MPKEVVQVATELGSAFISVGLGTNSLAGDIKKAFGSAESSGSDAGKSAGKGFGGAFGIAAAAVGALGIGSFFKSAITGAGDLQQSVGAIDAVFKGSAGQMHEWAKGAATDVGLTQDEYNQLGTVIGSQLKNGGTAMDELAPKTSALIGTGADLASMFGGTTADAVGALSSALKGERDPIERYGVSLNQAKIDAEAASLGFAKVGGTLSAEATQAATLSLIMKQTADAHGNFASEADTLAHKQQVLNAQWADGKAQIGAALLPAVSSLTGTLSSALGPAMNGALTVIKEVSGGFTAMGAAFKAGDGDITSSGFAGVMEQIGGAARPVFDTLKEIGGSLATSFGPLIPQVLALASSFSPLGLIFKVIQPILPQLVGLFTQLGSIVAGVLGTALTSLTPVVEMLVGQLSAMAIQLMPAVTQIVGMLGETMATLAPIIGQVIAQLAPLIMSLMTQLAPIITNLISTILPPLVSIFGDIVGAIGPLITILMGVLIPVIEALMPVVVTVFGVVADVIKNVMRVVQGIIQVVTGIISGDWGKVWEGIQNIFGGIWDTIVSLVGGAIKIVWSVISNGMNLVFGFIGGILGNIGNFFADTWNNITRGISDFVGGIGKFFESIPGTIMGALSGAGQWLFDAGKNIVEGLFNGIKSLASTIGNFFLGLLPGWIVEPFKIALGIHSPSKVFRGLGVNIGQGLLLGVGDMEGKIDNTMTGLVSVPAVPSFGAGSFTSAFAGSGAGGRTYNTTINQVDDPIGTSHAVARRLQSLSA